MKKFTIEIDCPEGYRPVAFRQPKVKESYMSCNGYIFTCDHEGEVRGKRLIVEKIKPVERVFRLVSEDKIPAKGQ